MADVITKGGSFKEQASDLIERAEAHEKSAKAHREKANQQENYGSSALDHMLGTVAMDDDEKDADQSRSEAEYDEARAKEYRQRAKELNEAPIESVMGDIGPASYKKPLIAAGVVTVVIVVGYFLYAKAPAPKTTPDVIGKYYRVRADDAAGDTGTEVCARAGLKCIGYTDLTQTTCKQFHPGAKTSEDLNGSKAGFYCDGPPQGGICATETDTCHICPKCNLNMACDTVIGDLYRETFVECGEKH